MARAQAWLSDAESLLAAPPDEFVADRKGRDLALFYLFLAIQESIDLAAHWVADEGWAPPDDAGSTFESSPTGAWSSGRSPTGSVLRPA